MGYTTFKNNGQPALSDTVLNNMQVELMKLVFPIGSTYVTQSNTNPSTILNFGTWERLKGKVCLGVDENDEDFKTIGKTGGEKKHTLTINEIPSHKHSLPYSVWGNISGAYQQRTSENVGNYSGEIKETNQVGGGQSHNNMQPYEVVGYMWIRRA